MTVSLPNFPIHIIARKKCLEVYLRNVSKATAVRRIFEHNRHKQRRSSLSSFDRSLGSVTLSPINREEFTLGNHDDDAVHEFCDFVLCIGDDRADEYMFQYIRKITEGASALDNGDKISRVSFQEGKEDLKIITCTVGSKSSAARYYLPSYSDVLTFLFNI
jgi:trehalose-phosphatase